MQIFLSKLEVEKLYLYKYKVIDDSLLGKYISAFCTNIQYYVPTCVHPNIISIIGFLCIFIAWLYSGQIANNMLSSFVYITCITTYMILDSLDGVHARKTNMASPVGEIIDHLLDFFSSILLSVSALNIFRIYEPIIVYMCLRFVTASFIGTHISAYGTGYLHLGFFTDTTLIILILDILVLLQNISTFNIALNNFIVIIGFIFYFVGSAFIFYKILSNKISKNSKLVMITYYSLFIITEYCIIMTLTDHIPMYPLLFSHYFLLLELFIAKMLKRDIQSWIIIIPFLNLVIPSFGYLSIIYFIASVIEISKVLNLNILTKN